jgi:prepilin-type N-terminal cleavage/methylation domain-containing protein
MKAARGHTLLEILVSTAILSVILVSLYSAFHTGLLSYQKVESEAELYRTGRIILSFIESDLRNAFIYSETESRFKGDPWSMQFMAHPARYDALPKVYRHVAKVRYTYAASSLKRALLVGLSALTDTGDPGEEELSGRVRECAFEYATADKSSSGYSWYSSWPNVNAGEQKMYFPLAVRVRLIVEAKSARRGEEKNTMSFSKIITLR